MNKLDYGASYMDALAKCVSLEEMYRDQYVVEHYIMGYEFILAEPNRPYNVVRIRVSDNGSSVPDDAVDAINAIIHGKMAVTPSKSGTDWDKRFLLMAMGEINTWSKDPSTTVSATVFKDKHPIASSYNGFPAGIADTNERLHDRDLKYKLTLHAEANAVAVCAKLGIATQGCTIAVTHPPCYNCAALLIQAGISKVVTKTPSEDFVSRWKESIDFAKEMFEEAGVEYIMIDMESEE